MEKHKKCCFIGHRKVENEKQIKEKLYAIVEALIVQEGVEVFLFGRRSAFNSICHAVVSNLRCKYPHVKRVFYTCRGEKCTLRTEAIRKNIFKFIKRRGDFIRNGRGVRA